MTVTHKQLLIKPNTRPNWGAVFFLILSSFKASHKGALFFQQNAFDIGWEAQSTNLKNYSIIKLHICESLTFIQNIYKCIDDSIINTEYMRIYLSLIKLV